jgi:hypothetical protein
MLSLNKLKDIIIYDINNLVNKWSKKLTNAAKIFFTENLDIKIPITQIHIYYIYS